MNDKTNRYAAVLLVHSTNLKELEELMPQLLSTGTRAETISVQLDPATLPGGWLKTQFENVVLHPSRVLIRKVVT